MIKGKLENGFEYQVEYTAVNNMELVDAIAEVEENPVAISKVVKLLLGNDQRMALYDYLRTKDGNVPIDAVNKAVIEIFNSSQQGKN